MSANTWTDTAITSNTWIYSDNLLYVDIGYWENGYVDNSTQWTNVTANSNTWDIQG